MTLGPCQQKINICMMYWEHETLWMNSTPKARTLGTGHGCLKVSHTQCCRISITCMKVLVMNHMLWISLRRVRENPLPPLPLFSSSETECRSIQPDLIIITCIDIVIIINIHSYYTQIKYEIHSYFLSAFMCKCESNRDFFLYWVWTVMTTTILPLP